jgi:hypothetical protein
MSNNKEKLKIEIKEYIDVFFDVMCKGCNDCCLESETSKEECKICQLDLGMCNLFGVDLVSEK